MIEAKGINGTLILGDEKITIQRKGIWQGALNGDKDIYLSQISSIQTKKAGLMNIGFIEFAFMGGQESHGSFLNPYRNENTITFNSKQQKDFENIKTEIEQYLLKRQQSVHQDNSNIDDLEKLAALRDKGIVSQEEFEFKKKQILGMN